MESNEKINWRTGRWRQRRWERSPLPLNAREYLADLRSRANSQQYSSIYEDQRPQIEDIERSDGETTKPGVLKRPELDRVKPINVSSRPVSTGD